jgi:hypothetical protein
MDHVLENDDTALTPHEDGQHALLLVMQKDHPQDQILL